jgi:hypothetical protein
VVSLVTGALDPDLNSPRPEPQKTTTASPTQYRNMCSLEFLFTDIRCSTDRIESATFVAI